ncbi:MAG: nucleotidyltransferase domain-containing protein [Candidatus Micrarchaeota archaeon]
MLEKLLRSKAGVKLLGVALFNNGFHLRELARKANISPFEAKRELDILVDIGLLIRKKSGNQVLFYTNRDCSFLQDIKNLYQKTEGFFSLLKEAFSQLNVDYAFVFGSMAKGTEKPNSDIDVMIIGDESDTNISDAIFNIQKKSKREINFILWSKKDFQEKLRSKNIFLSNILNQKIVWVMGDENEFGRIVKDGFSKKIRTK